MPWISGLSQITLDPATVGGVTDKAKDTVFQKIEGIWLLNFGRGEEEVKIERNGEYYVTSEKKGPRLAFKLVLLAHNDDFSEIELGKDELNGRRRQIEVLTLSPVLKPTQMKGVAKHDQHPLLYAKKES